MFAYKLLRDDINQAVIGIYDGVELVAKIKVHLGYSIETRNEIKKAVKALIPVFERTQPGAVNLTNNLREVLVTTVFYEMTKTRI